MEVQLGAIESAVALVDLEGLAHVGDSVFQDVLVMLPLLHSADVILRHGAEFNGVAEAEGGVHFVEQADRLLDHVLHLVRGHEDVGVVLGEAADPEQAVERTGQLVPVYQAQLAHPQGQLPVGVRLAGVDQHAAGAVHGLDGVILFVDNSGVHVLLIVVPVAGTLPQLTVEDDGGGDLHIAVLLVDLAPVIQQGVFQGHALGQEEGEARPLVPQHEQAQLPAQLPVVPLLSLFDPLEVGIQLVLLREGDAVNPLEGLPVGITPPVGGVASGELEGVALDAAGGVQMGAGAEIRELALLVEGDMGVCGQVVDKLHLVGLCLLLHELQSLLPGQFEPLQLQLLLADLPHLCLDLLQVLRREGEGGVQVVVPALVDGGADGQLHLRPQALHGLGHHVGAGVPVGLAVRRILKGKLVVLHFFRHG